LVAEVAAGDSSNAEIADARGEAVNAAGVNMVGSPGEDAKRGEGVEDAESREGDLWRLALVGAPAAREDEDVSEGERMLATSGEELPSRPGSARPSFWLP
jgi:hypothetical protein